MCYTVQVKKEMDVPGHLGYGILGDRSLEFVRSPRDYIQRQRKTHGDIFKGRILNKPHVFLTSNRAVEDFLTSNGLPGLGSGRLCSWSKSFVLMRTLASHAYSCKSFMRTLASHAGWPRQ